MSSSHREAGRQITMQRPHHPTTSLLRSERGSGCGDGPTRDSRRDMTDKTNRSFNDVPDDEYVTIPYTGSPDAKWGWQ